VPGVAGKMTSTDCTAIFSGWAPYSPSFTSILRTKDGVVHLLGVAKSAAGRRIINYRSVPYGTGLNGKPAPILVYNFAIRSTDGGASFSAPANIDGSPASGGTSDDGHAMNQKEASEVSIAELASGELLALVRPNVSPFCWESRSATGGTSWAPLTRGSFPMYAMFNSMITTRSGVVLVCGRYPAISCQASWDSGMTWRLFTVDLSSAWAQGSLIELATDDHVLWFYASRGRGAGSRPYQLRTQVLKISHDPPGLVAVL
jgi:hypothetical protein